MTETEIKTWLALECHAKPNGRGCRPGAKLLAHLVGRNQVRSIYIALAGLKALGLTRTISSGTSGKAAERQQLLPPMNVQFRGAGPMNPGAPTHESRRASPMNPGFTPTTCGTALEQHGATSSHVVDVEVEDHEAEKAHREKARRDELRHALERAGISEPNRSALVRTAGLTAMHVFLAEQESAQAAKSNPAGWIVRRLQRGVHTFPSFLTPKAACALANLGIVASIAGVEIPIGRWIKNNSSGLYIEGDDGEAPMLIPAERLLLANFRTRTDDGDSSEFREMRIAQ